MISLAVQNGSVLINKNESELQEKDALEYGGIPKNEILQQSFVRLSKRELDLEKPPSLTFVQI